MKILITGSSRGIGRATALKYLELGHEVIGLDILKSSISHAKYTHFVVDITEKESLPDLENIDIIFNNAGKQNSVDDITNNLKGAINVTEKYGFMDSIKSILFNASASAVTGQEFPEYVASKAGMLGYMKNIAIRLASKQVTVNAISLGGVITESNKEVIEDKDAFTKIMQVTPMKKWMSEEEVVDFVIFLTIVNKSMSGQNLIIDNGEKDLNPTFVWPGYNLK